MTNRFISKGLMVAIAFTLSCSAPLVYAQTNPSEKITITVDKKPLGTVLEKLSKLYNYQFFYNASLLKGINVSVALQATDIHKAMDALLSGTGLQYTLKGKTIVITAIQKKAVAKTLLIGRVTDSEGVVVPGVTVFTKDKSQGTVTDIDGRFSFPQPLEYGTLLTFSSIGMKPTHVVYSGEKTLQVVMTEDIQQLEAVIVTGFQTISRERSTGAATIVKKEYLDKIQAPNLSSKLEGITPGLTTYGGQMSIRGVSSFAVNSTPLLVLDGQPVTGVSINELNPDDIETITVLKDAAATSLYGVRASNGVIVVSTKRGVSKKPNITVSANFYMDPLPSLDYQHYASPGDIIDYEREYMMNNPTYKDDPMKYFDNLNRPEGPQYMSQVSRLYYELAKGNITEGELNKQLGALSKNDYRREYQKLMQQMKFKQDYNVSIMKGGDKSSFFFSGRYENEGSYTKHDRADKFTFYMKNELELTDWFKLTLGANTAIGNSRYSYADGLGPTTQMAYDALQNADGTPAYVYPRNYYLSQRLGETEGLMAMGYNAMEESKNNNQTTNDLYWKLFAHADFKLLKGLDLGLKFQYEDRGQNGERYDEGDSYYMRELINTFASTNPKGGFIYNIPQGGRLGESHSRWSYLNFRAQFDYETTFAEKHDLTALLGGEIREDNYRGTSSERFGYDDSRLTYKHVDWATLNQQGVIGQMSTNAMKRGENLSVGDSKHRYVSAYFNLGYSYDSRYALNGSVRVEQADLFGTDPKYRYRPLWSVGASWNVSNEAFMKEITWIDLLKLRATYGITGNVDQSSSPYLLGAYGNSPYSNANLTDIMTPPNKLLRWEKTSTFNLGLDFALFKRLSGSFEFYTRYSSDLLANKSLDPSIGFESARVNNGAMSNRGIELSLTYDWLKSKEWSLNTTLTASYNKNKIDKVGYVPTDAVSMMSSPTSNYLKGDVYNSLYAYRYAGLTETGDPSVYDVEGNIVSIQPLRDIEALVCVGQLTPKWNGALDISLQWKSLSFFTKIVYYTGHSLRVDAMPLYTGIENGTGKANGAIHEDIANRWTPEHTDTDIPSISLYGTAGDRGYQWKYADYNTASASFLKVRNIGLAYALPQQWMGKSGFKGMNLRAQINNPFYWAANNRDIDPEAFYANSGTRMSQQMTSYIVGINMNF